MSLRADPIPPTTPPRPERVRAPAAGVRTSGLRWKRMVALKGFSFTVPFFLGFVLFTVVPVVMALGHSLYKTQSSGLGFGEKTAT